MKTKKLITVILLIFTVSFFACDNNKPEESEMNFPREVEFTLLSRTHCWYDDVTVDSLHIFNSSEELKNYIDCRPSNIYPEIDFSKHTLLFVRNRNIGPIREVTMSLIQHSEYRYDLNITVYWWNTIIGSRRIEGLILVPKISDKADVVLNLEYIQTF